MAASVQRWPQMNQTSQRLCPCVVPSSWTCTGPVTCSWLIKCGESNVLGYLSYLTKKTLVSVTLKRFILGSIPLGNLWEDPSFVDKSRGKKWGAVVTVSTGLPADINGQLWDWVTLDTQPSCHLTASMWETLSEYCSAKQSIHSSERDSYKLLF